MATKSQQPSAPSGGLAKKKNPIKAILAGGISGGIEIMITFPTEFVKTQLQLSKQGTQHEAGTTIGKSVANGQRLQVSSAAAMDEMLPVKQYKGIVDCVRQTMKEHGPLGLYRGLTVLLYGSIPKSAVRFGSYEFFRNRLVADNGKLSQTRTLLCGLLAGSSEAIFAVCPMETIKVKFIDDRRRKQPRYRSFFHGVSTIIKEEGLRGCYKGLAATIVKQGTNQGIRFLVYNNLKAHFQGGDQNKNIGTLLTFLCGGTAGAASVFGNTPVDVVKTRMQGLEASKYRSTWDCAVQIWKKEGVLAFYKGTSARLARVCLDVGIVFVLYENVMRVLDYVYPTKGQ